MDAALTRFREAAGFDATQLVVLISIVAVATITMWACWSAMGQFQLLTGGEISVGKFIFGLCRVIAMVTAVSYVMSEFI